MLTVNEYARIRHAHRQGMSIRAIAQTFGHCRRSVRKALAEAEPQSYTLKQPRAAPKLGRFHKVIEQVLAEDEEAPPKQRHTAMQIYRRLVREHQYDGGYDQVRRYVARHRKNQRATFIPLDHPAGERMEADFGHIHVDYPDGRQLVSVLLVTWSFSHARFAIKLPSERVEAILAGLVAAMNFFGCVARQLWWDNPTTIATKILKGRQRQLHERYAAWVSHYGIDPMACMPAAGWEKPDVEHSVFDLQRRWATPVPRVRDDDELNAHLLACCKQEMDRTVRGQQQTIGQRFELDKQAAMALPSVPFDPCVYHSGKVDKYQSVIFDTNHYSVPRPLAFTTVTLKVFIDRIEVVDRGKVVTVHARSYQRGQWILDPLHYLAALSRRPAALDHAPVYRDWHLPPTFVQLREQFESRLGPPAGCRQFIRVLQLLAHHPLDRVQKAIERSGPVNDAQAIIRVAERLGKQATPDRCDQVEQFNHQKSIVQPQVPVPDLGQFNQLLTTYSGDHA